MIAVFSRGRPSRQRKSFLPYNRIDTTIPTRPSRHIGRLASPNCQVAAAADVPSLSTAARPSAAVWLAFAKLDWSAAFHHDYGAFRPSLSHKHAKHRPRSYTDVVFARSAGLAFLGAVIPIRGSVTAARRRSSARRRGVPVYLADRVAREAPHKAYDRQARRPNHPGKGNRTRDRFRRFLRIDIP